MEGTKSLSFTMVYFVAPFAQYLEIYTTEEREFELTHNHSTFTRFHFFPLICKKVLINNDAHENVS